MRYLVNRKTKEHQRMPFDCLYAPSGWRIVQADSEGWIKHEGNDCPLPAGTKVEINMEDGTYSVRNNAETFDWTACLLHEGDAITRYRPILAEKVQEPEAIPEPPECRWPTCSCERHDCIEMPEPRERQLLGRLKAAHEAAQQIPDLEAELREVLAGMGYDLVARSPFANQCCCNPAQCWEPCGVLGKSEAHVAVSPEPDMSDWRNWREGDLLKCVNSKGWDCFDMGDIYRVTKHDCAFICVDGVAVVKQYINDFRFHSRPAKGE